jgi:HK97 family phage major capsid protein
MELKEQLEALTLKLEGKSQTEVKSAIEAFELKNNEVISNQIKEVKESFELQLKELQNHADKLDVKLQEKAKKEMVKGDAIKSAINENFDLIKAVRKGQAVQVKAVGDMTLGASLTGDQPRDYNYDVVSVPGQALNVSDLAGSVSISGGTYTFVKVVKGEGSIGAQTEGASKSQIDYDYTMVDVNTDFIAGFARYSKKMANNLPFLESSLPNELRRDYLIAENAAFNTVLAGAATASALTTGNKIERLIANVAVLEGINHVVNGVVISPADYWDILVTEKSTGAGYGLPGVVTFEGGVLRISGIPIYKATWLAANKYFVGDWSRVKKIVTEGLSLDFSETEGSNFVKNEITARIEAQVALAVEQPSALIFGDFTTVA